MPAGARRLRRFSAAGHDVLVGHKVLARADVEAVPHMAGPRSCPSVSFTLNRAARLDPEARFPESSAHVLSFLSGRSRRQEAHSFPTRPSGNRSEPFDRLRLYLVTSYVRLVGAGP